jgi:hypothetical protein
MYGVLLQSEHPGTVDAEEKGRIPKGFLISVLLAPIAIATGIRSD